MASKSILILTFLFSQNLHAQIDSLQTAQLKKAALDSICQCISKIDTTVFKEVKQVEEQVSACYTSYDKELLLLYVAGTGKKLSKDSEAKFKKFVSSLGGEVYDNCKSMRILNAYLRSRLPGKKEF